MFYVANWKMQMDERSIKQFFQKFQLPKRKNPNTHTCIIAPSSIHIPLVRSCIDQKKLPVKIACQNIFWEPEGAYTGEISTKQLQDYRVEYALIGHSERIMNLSENAEMIAKKIKNCLDHKVTPILLIGDDEPKDINRAKKTVASHIKVYLSKVLSKNYHLWKDMIFVYEPVFAVSTNRHQIDCSSQRTSTMIDFMEERLKKIITCRKDFTILYGGSVNPDNAKDYLSLQNCDGVLVGGASLKAEKFNVIINSSINELTN